MSNVFKKEKILITGGSGSLGKRLTQLLRTCNQIVVYSRNEERQFDMQQEFGFENIEYFIGDVRDKCSLKKALRGCSLAIHAAAMKDLVMCEQQPTQTCFNNIDGSRVFLEATAESSVRKAIGVSTDKAAAPTNVYGATKYIMEKMFIEANYCSSKEFFCIRFGNMIDSKGSLVQNWKSNPDLDIKITHPKVSRFFFTVETASASVIQALKIGTKGKIYIPKMKKAPIIDILRVITNKDTFSISGLSPGEKVHEILMNEEECRFCFDEDDFFVIDYSRTNPTPPALLSSATAQSFTDEELYKMIFLDKAKYG